MTGGPCGGQRAGAAGAGGGAAGVPTGGGPVGSSGDRAGVGAALVEPEGRIAVGHQPGVGGDPERPPVHAEDEVVEGDGVAAGEQQHDRGDQHEQADQAAGAPAVVPAVVRPAAGAQPQPAADEDRQDEVVRDGQQPPLHQHQATGQPFGVGHVQVRRVVRHLGQGERRVAVGAQGAVAVVVHPPGPAQHADVEVEQRPRIAPGEQDREERDHADHEEAPATGRTARRSAGSAAAT